MVQIIHTYQCAYTLAIAILTLFTTNLVGVNVSFFEISWTSWANNRKTLIPIFGDLNSQILGVSVQYNISIPMLPLDRARGIKSAIYLFFPIYKINHKFLFKLLILFLNVLIATTRSPHDSVLRANYFHPTIMPVLLLKGAKHYNYECYYYKENDLL